MERRTFLKGAVIAGATPAAAWAPSRPHDGLDTLFSDYEHAIEFHNHAWKAVGDLADSEDMRAAPAVRIQVGRRVIGKDEVGNDVFQPIYAHRAEEIEEYERTTYAVKMLFAGHEDAKARVEAWFSRSVSEKVGRLNAVKAETKDIENACGYTAALEIAEGASTKVREIEQAILDFVPATLEDAARKARWIVAELQGDRALMLDRNDIALVALTAIGRAIG
ncbi:hypothetical protein HJA89_27815 [Rhizobium bangladeshense]|uniref:hypothetical protein n=1 Tax=Rhizobium TaxID=379 RepID=UPI001C82FD32|nr:MULTISPECIES: hypothetical protein [Rhizobium]MBX4876648.1 hypothetical protein [Rhizobium bangladeshense]MBX4887572.1 hypothetical protein [Rhizobium bangladeshense]MBX5146371.1 hypothetical protein [Rhizobium lentis]